MLTAAEAMELSNNRPETIRGQIGFKGTLDVEGKVGEGLGPFLPILSIRVKSRLE